MDDKTNDQIRAMLDAHIDADTIKKVLGVTNLDIIGSEDREQPEPSPVYTGGRNRYKRAMKVTMEKFYEVKDLYADGFSQKEIASKTGLGTTTISKIVNCYDYQNYKAMREEEAKLKAEKEREARNKFFDEEAKRPPKNRISPELVELRALNDTLLRIAEALERKRGLFRK